LEYVCFFEKYEITLAFMPIKYELGIVWSFLE
jgi:hypothetical protein